MNSVCNAIEPKGQQLLEHGMVCLLPPWRYAGWLVEDSMVDLAPQSMLNEDFRTGDLWLSRGWARWIVIEVGDEEAVFRQIKAREGFRRTFKMPKQSNAIQDGWTLLKRVCLTKEEKEFARERNGFLLNLPYIKKNKIYKEAMR